ncbi:sarcosine oxidase [Paramicrobacterium humi]|uniref:Sarcosine oxidase n=1 Tax=Paramicrobacterium humi TaxID=640635 RepID=A0A1H4KQ04_9MICO|nr:N-methyl-L-tryptophan oxidase [Microbacterium humi]SEB60577.1 sarcosine oxidase [Microbacterium humi]
MEHADIAVVGTGAIGAAAAWRLAERGADVVAFERFAPGHALGSSHGDTRLFREACLEHPDLTPMAQSSRALFRELEALSGDELLTITGGVMIGAADSSVVSGTVAAAERAGLPLEHLDAAGVRERFPQHAGIGDRDVAVLDPGAGVARPERTVRAAAAAASARGARIITGTRVTAIEPGTDGVVIRTADAAWHVDRVILAAGAWLPGFAPWLRLTPIRTPLTWLSPREHGDTAFAVAAFPVVVRQLDAENVLWGHGALDGGLVKIGRGDIWGEERPGIDPDHVDRGVTSDDWRLLSPLVSRALPGLEPVPSRVEPCMITLSPDDQFVIGASPDSERVIVAGGDSGHAFKHCLAIGEVKCSHAPRSRRSRSSSSTSCGRRGSPPRFPATGRRAPSHVALP